MARIDPRAQAEAARAAVAARHRVAAPTPVEAPVAPEKAKRKRRVDAPKPVATRPVRVKLSPTALPMTVEMPTVESRFTLAFREPTTDNPGLVLTDAGAVYLVEEDGTRILLSGGGGGGSWPTFMQLDNPGDGAIGDTWVRPVGGYPDEFGVGAFFWNPTASTWQQIAPVALADNGDVLGIIDVDSNGIIVLESFDTGNAGGSTVYVEPNQILLTAQKEGGIIHLRSADGSTIDMNEGASPLQFFGNNDGGPPGMIVQSADDAQPILALIDSSADTITTIGSGGTVIGQSATTETTALVVVAGAGALADGDPIVIVEDGDSNNVFVIDSHGLVTITPTSPQDALIANYVGGGVSLRTGTAIAGTLISLPNSRTFSVNNSQAAADILTAATNGGGVSVLGFFGATPVIQQNLGGGSTLGDVIALLQAYGLAGSI